MWNETPYHQSVFLVSSLKQDVKYKRNMTFTVNLKLNCGNKLSRYFFCPLILPTSPSKQFWVRPRKIWNGKVNPKIQWKLPNSWLFSVPFVSEKRGVVCVWGPTLCTAAKLPTYQDFCSSVRGVLSVQYQVLCWRLNINPNQYVPLGNVPTKFYAE